MTSLTDLHREQIHHFRDLPVRTGEVVRVDPDGIWVDVDGETPGGPHPYVAPSAPDEGDPCLVFDTAEGDRFVVVITGQTVIGGVGPQGPQGVQGEPGPVGPPGPAGLPHEVRDEGTVLAARDALNFTGVGVQAVDNPAADSTDVVVPGDARYVHNQLATATVWSVAHGLGKFPSITVIDSGGSEVFPDVTYVDANNLTVTFAHATSGKVYVN